VRGAAGGVNKKQKRRWGGERRWMSRDKLEQRVGELYVVIRVLRDEYARHT
jgi:hypothetical protein